MVLLDDLGVDELARIFLESPDSGYQQSRAYFESRGLRLTLSPAAVQRIASEAARHPRLGARALREVFRRIVRDHELDPQAGSGASGGALMIDEPEVEAALQAASRP
jgi:ATP-dependent protease Clp ATPase subunit